MRRIAIPAVVLITVLILTGGFFLPNYISGFKDRQTIGKLDVTDGGGISFETKSELGIIDRLKMMTSAPSISLDNGKNMNAETAYQTALSELGTFNSLDVIDLDTAACRLSKYGVSFFIDSADPSKNLIVWDLLIQDKMHDIAVSVDDETGKLLSLQYRTSLLEYQTDIPVTTRSDKPMSFDTEMIGQTIADYYGLTLVGWEPAKSDQYKRLLLDLNDGQESITIAVTFTGYGFMVNI